MDVDRYETERHCLGRTSSSSSSYILPSVSSTKQQH